jgi:HSP20 family protein
MLRRTFGRTLSPWREMERLQRDMNRLFAGLPRERALSAAPSYPAMNVWTNEEGAVVTAELPGCDPENIDISVQGETLTVHGSRQPDELQEGQVYHRRERGCGSFTRSFQLPFSVQADQVEATFSKGVLSISLPRAEADKRKKIAIKAG